MAGKSIGELKAQAQKLTLAGKRAQAAETYREIAQLEPENPRWPQKAGEEFRTIGRKDAAISAFHASARLYAHQGFALKAITLCKVILEIDAANAAAQEMLGSFAKSAPPASVPPRPAPAAPAPAPPPAAGAPSAPPPRVSASAPPATAPRAAEAASARDPQALPASAPAPTPKGPVPASAAPTPKAPPPATPAVPAPPAGPGPAIPPGQALETLDLSRVLKAAGTSIDEEVEAVDIVVDELEEQQEGDIPEQPVPAPASPAPTAHREAILTQMPPVPIFSFLGKSALRALVDRASVRTFAPGERIVAQGEEGNSLFVLVEGEVRVLSEGPPRVELARLTEGAFFGEIALITKAPRTATVEAEADCQVLEISRDVFNELVRGYPEIIAVVLRYLRERLVQGLVKTHPLFTPFAGSERTHLARRFALVEVAADRRLADEGAAATGLHILLCGEAEVRRGGAPPARLKPGDLVGVEALLTGQPSPVTVTTLAKSWLLTMKEETFREVIMAYPPVLATLSEAIQEQRARTAATAGGPPVPQGVPLY